MRKYPKRMRKMVAMVLLLASACGMAHAQQREGCHVQEIIDVDGDLQILMESEWISMHIMPEHQAMVVRFVFRPTGNDILDVVQPKNAMSGYGLLQDNFWGQDWRYSEFRGRFYDYQIVKNTPEEVAVAFETVSEGWQRSNNSGLISKLWSNVRIRRTVRLRSGAPYFLFDMELINEDNSSKLVPMWMHHASLVDQIQGDFVYRPSRLGNRAIGKTGDLNPTGGDHYIYDFNEGWSARIAPMRREGLVYLMDYDYLNFLYNSGTTTAEWILDNVLIPPGRRWTGRVHILPVIGLSKVEFASEHFIVDINPRREDGRLDIVYEVSASYEPVRRITFNADLTYGHYRGEGQPDDPRTIRLEPVEVENLGVSPVTAVATVDEPTEDPLVLAVRAHIELPDGTLRTRTFQTFHVGEYRFGRNVRMDMSTPVARLDRRPQAPWLPEVPAGLSVARDGDWKVFAVLGPYSRRLGIREHVRSLPARLEEEQDLGYTPGFYAPTLGLSDFPFDFDRLFDYRVMVWANSHLDVARLVGAAVLSNYLEAGGGLVLTGGDHAFERIYEDPANPIYDYVPIVYRPDNLRRGVERLNSPEVGHPIFDGVDVSDLPFAYFTHHVEVKPDMNARVLLRVGDHPFIVESGNGKQRTLVVLCAPFGNPEDYPDHTPFWEWPEWPKLFANVVKYAGHGEKNQ